MGQNKTWLVIRHKSIAWYLKLRFRIRRFPNRHRNWAIGIASILGTIVFLGVLFVVLVPFTWLIGGGSVRNLHGAAQVAALNSIRQILLTALGGSAALVALGFTVRTYYLSRRGQVTDRFNKAIAQLASEKLEERLGGIYALEHVMLESPTDHAAVLGVLCAFVRTRTMIASAHFSPCRVDPMDQQPPPFGTEPSPDIDAAMIAIARRPKRPEPNRPDLRRVRLVGLSIRAYDFAKQPRLTRMFLTASDLRRADLRGADLRGTIATGADLRWAWFDEADLSHTSLTRTQLRGARMKNTDLTETQLEDADLRDVKGLTAQQLSRALLDDKTLFSPELTEDPWVKARIRDCNALPDDAGPWACPPPTPRPESGLEGELLTPRADTNALGPSRPTGGETRDV